MNQPAHLENQGDESRSSLDGTPAEVLAEAVEFVPEEVAVSALGVGVHLLQDAAELGAAIVEGAADLIGDSL